MAYLSRINYLPKTDTLSERETQSVLQHFEAHSTEVVIHGISIPWNKITEIEVAQAARSGGVGGWVVKHVVMGGERYHVGVYAGDYEAVLTNMTWNAMRFVMQTLAYYAPRAIKYTGPDGVIPLSTEGE